MGVITGPHPIRDGLIVGYDISTSSDRYYPGEPTTNLNPTGGLNSMGIGFNPVAVEDGWTKYTLSGTWTGGTYPYICNLSGVSFTGGVKYSTQVKIKTNCQHKFNYFAANGISYVNQPMDYGGTNSSELLSDGSYLLRRQGFAYTSTTNQPGYLWTNPISNVYFNPSYDFVWIKDFQIEQKDHCTKPTSSSRSGTQSFIDLTNTYSLDVSDMSFNSSGLPVFDGVSNKVQLSSDVLASNQAYTLFCVIKPTNISSPDYSFPWYNSYPSGFWHHVTAGGVAWRHSGGSGNLSGWSISNGVYTTIALTWDGSTISIYQNGNFISSTSNPYSYSTNSAARFGMLSNRYTANDYNYNGEAPVNLVYGRALTAAEIKYNHDIYKTRFGI